jgi:thioredoxin-dependent peroxiredoxin
MLHRHTTFIAGALLAAASAAGAQAPATPPAADAIPKVGDMAPDFTLKGSTKDGLLSKPIHLADFRGQTVVLAFFPKARTKG